MKSVLEFKARKGAGPKIVMVSAYTHWEARFLAASPVDCILVGDSLAVVLDGESQTFAATPEIMARHTQAVVRGAGGKLVVADFPFLEARKGLVPAVECAAALLRAGAHAVKLEGIDGHEDVVRHLVRSGVPVMGHLGLTPQSTHALGGHKVQGRGEAAADDLLRQARALETAGVFGLVLECVPAAVARDISAALSIPVIGIGAGVDTDGQVLVFHDLLGLNPGFNAKFVRHFAEAGDAVANGLAAYSEAVKSGNFPAKKESY